MSTSLATHDKVLVVDDEPQIVTSLKDLLENEFTVLTTTSADAALDILRNDRVAVILSDQRMPGLTGDQFLKRAREVSDATRVLITGYADMDALIRAVNDGSIYAYVSKPWEPDELQLLVMHAAEHHRLIAELQGERELLHTLMDNIPDSIFFKDGNLRYTRLNRTAARALGADDPADVVGKKDADFFTRVIAKAIHRHEEEIVKNKRSIVDKIEETQIAGGDKRWISTTKAPIVDHSGNANGVVGISRDITARYLADQALRESEERLRRSEERYALAARGANDGLWDWDLVTDKVYYSPRWKQMLGYDEPEIGNTPREWLSRVHEDDAVRVRMAIERHRAGETDQFQTEHRIRHKDGRFRWVLSRGLAVRDGTGRATRMAGSQTDITERKRAEEQLQHDAFHDALTGLPNRALFLDRVTSTLKRAGRDRANSGRYFAVLFIDVDRFKVINDSLGHGRGDRLLIGIAKRLQESTRTVDTVARLGGDEFGILLDPIESPDLAIRLANRYLDVLAEPILLNGRETIVTASIGVALGKADYRHAEELLRDADTAMNRAKAKGRRRCELFDSSMHQLMVQVLQLETDLRRALEEKQFEPYYQPIVSLSTGDIVGCEALARWNHPLRGLIAPAQFIGLAEETGMIITLDRQLAREACRQVAAWQHELPDVAPGSVSINLSGKHFNQDNAADIIQETLGRIDIPPDRLHIEVTESAVVENIDSASEMLKQLRDRGARICIDDFGTGYSSLSYLHRFPIDILKIDRSFVACAGAPGVRGDILRATVTMARSLGIPVVAEGVETAEQLAHLRSYGCEYAQGFYFSPPIRADAFEKLITARPTW